MKSYYYVVVLLVPVLFFCSCKKTKLEGELEILEGNWVWFRSYGTCPNQWSTCEATPLTEGFTIEYRLEKKGKYQLLKNGVEIEKGRIIVKTFDNLDPINEGGMFQILFKNSSKNKENDGSNTRLVGNDTLCISNYPMVDYDGFDYYVRQ
jgi:hypothetical protein